MKRRLCFLLVLVFILAFSGHAFADNDVLYCRMCGRQIPTDSRVCPYCGVAVVHVGEGTTAEAKTAATAPVQTQTAQSAAQTVQNTAQTTIPGPFNTTLSNTGVLINNNKVRVTKSPTSESVPYGGSCIFIAHAANASSVTWYIANEDGTSIATAYEAADNVSGLYVSGGNTDTLKLSGIPSWMNGFQVQACFTGEGGPVYTNVAKIWTYEEQVCEEEGEPFWWWDDYIRSLYQPKEPPPPPPPPPPEPPMPPPCGGNQPPQQPGDFPPFPPPPGDV